MGKAVESMAGKVVVVTGAGGAIGRAMALLFAQQGAHLVLNELGCEVSGEGGDASVAQQIADELLESDVGGAGGKIIANAASVADPNGATSIIEDAIEHFGRVDVVVNNAGIVRDRMFHKMTFEDWSQVLTVNLTGSFNVARAAATYFRQQNSGAYLHLVSTSALIGSLGQANYSAAKLGLVALSNSIALDMRRYQVRSNCIAPFSWSRMAGTLPERTEQEQERAKRFKTMVPGQIAPLAVSLCSDNAKHVSGQVFCVRKNEIFLFSQSRPICTMHRETGWTYEAVREQLFPALQSYLQPIQTSAEYFSWDPV